MDAQAVRDFVEEWDWLLNRRQQRDIYFAIDSGDAKVVKAAVKRAKKQIFDLVANDFKNHATHIIKNVGG